MAPQEIILSINDVTNERMTDEEKCIYGILCLFSGFRPERYYGIGMSSVHRSRFWKSMYVKQAP